MNSLDNFSENLGSWTNIYSYKLIEKEFIRTTLIFSFIMKYISYNVVLKLFYSFSDCVRGKIHDSSVIFLGIFLKIFNAFCNFFFSNYSKLCAIHIFHDDKHKDDS